MCRVPTTLRGRKNSGSLSRGRETLRSRLSWKRCPCRTALASNLAAGPEIVHGANVGKHSHHDLFLPPSLVSLLRLPRAAVIGGVSRSPEVIAAALLTAGNKRKARSADPRANWAGNLASVVQFVAIQGVILRTKWATWALGSAGFVGVAAAGLYWRREVRSTE